MVVYSANNSLLELVNEDFIQVFLFADHAYNYMNKYNKKLLVELDLPDKLLIKGFSYYKGITSNISSRLYNKMIPVPTYIFIGDFKDSYIINVDNIVNDSYRVNNGLFSLFDDNISYSDVYYDMVGSFMIDDDYKGVGMAFEDMDYNKDIKDYYNSRRNYFKRLVLSKNR